MTRVLIVDDQPPFRRQLRELLTRGGHTVVGETGNIASAENLIQTLKPDLAIVDILLPDINGLDGTARLKALYPGLRIILISAYRDTAFQVAARETGAESFIPKDELDINVVQR